MSSTADRINIDQIFNLMGQFHWRNRFLSLNEEMCNYLLMTTMMVHILNLTGHFHWWNKFLSLDEEMCTVASGYNGREKQGILRPV